MIPSWLTPILARYPRIGVAGGPCAGKTTLCRSISDRRVIATDDYQRLRWEDVPRAVMTECAAAGGRFVVEGVQVARSLRRGLQVDAVIWMEHPMVPLTKGQEAMRLGVVKVFADWKASAAGAVPVFFPVMR